MRDRSANVLVIAALMAPALFGFGAMALDLEMMMSARVKNQMVADAAALSAAAAYNTASSASAVLTPTVQNVAVANGLAATNVNAATVSNFPTSGNTAIQVTVTTSVPVTLASVFGFSGSYKVTAQAYAALVTTSTSTLKPCFLALSSGTPAIYTMGGALILASGCDVAAVGTIDNEAAGIGATQIVSSAGSVMNNWGYLSANMIYYATTFVNPWYNLLVPPAKDIVQKTNLTLTDVWATNSALLADRALVGTYVAPPALTSPTTGGSTTWDFSYSPSSAVSAYQTAPYSGRYVIPAGTYSIGSLTVESGVSVTFAAGTTLSVANGLTVQGGGTIVFGNANIAVNGGITSYSGFTMGSGTLQVGGFATMGGVWTIGAGNVTINGTTTLAGGSQVTMGAGSHRFQNLTLQGGSWMKLGTGDLDVTSGIVIGGGSTLESGTGNTLIGANSSGNAITIQGSGAMLTGAGTFSAAGSIVTGGGSRLYLPGSNDNYVNGAMNISGSLFLGPGAWFINGSLSDNTGGSTWPYYDPVSGSWYGQSSQGTSTSGYDIAGVNVSLFLSGTIQLGGAADTLLVAPTTTVTGGAIQDLVIDTPSTTPTNWSGGASTTLIGSAHLPNSAVTMSFGSSTLSNGQCFMLTANTITVEAGSIAASMCTSVGTMLSTGTATGTIQLVG